MFSFTPDFLPSSIVLIGAGGTGSRLMPMLSQLVRTCIKKHNANAWLDKLPIHVIDGDIVEEKNLLRQNFIQKDVGQPKASVLASRYGSAFGIEILPSTEFIKADAKPINFLGRSSDARFSFENSVVILAVDSAEARRVILKRILQGFGDLTYERARCFVIDAGNEDSFGQVKFFTLNPLVSSKSNQPSLERFIKGFPNQVPNEYKTSIIPFDAEYYMSLGSSAQELSCADLPQTLAINAMMATMICCVVQNFLYLKPMNFDGIRFSMTGSITTEYCSPKRWLRRIDYDTTLSKKIGFSVDQLVWYSYDANSDRAQFTNIYADTREMYSKAGMIVNDNGDVVPDPKKIPVLKPLEPATGTIEGVLANVSAAGVPPLVPLKPAPSTAPAPELVLQAATNRPRRTRAVARN